MKKLMAGVTVAVLVGGLAVVAMADPPGCCAPVGGPGMMDGGPGPGRMAMMQGRMAMMQARMATMGPGCAGVAATSDAAAPAVDEGKATALATEYAAKHFKGYTVERVLPFEGRFHTAYQVELKGPAGETRALHVNPWGGVRPAPVVTR